MRKGVQDQCVSCGKIYINNYWYKPSQTPPHPPRYRGAMCPECRQKRLGNKENDVQSKSVKKTANKRCNPEIVIP